MKKNKIGLFLLTATILIGINSSVSAATTKIETGKKVSLSYKLLVEGELIESADAKQPFSYTHGQRQIVPGLEKNLTGLKVGDKKTIKVPPQEAYGQMDLKQFLEFDKKKLPKDIPMKVGTMVEARSPKGEVRLVKIKEIKDKTVVLDFNHPLSGKELEFQIEVLKIV